MRWLHGQPIRLLDVIQDQVDCADELGEGESP